MNENIKIALEDILFIFYPYKMESTKLIKENVTKILEWLYEQSNKEGISEGTNIIYKVLESIKVKKPIGVSQWKEYGKAMGYWKYFESEVKRKRDEEIKNNLLKVADEGELEELRREVERYFKKNK